MQLNCSSCVCDEDFKSKQFKGGGGGGRGEMICQVPFLASCSPVKKGGGEKRKNITHKPEVSINNKHG